jgi:hypothetical protein
MSEVALLLSNTDDFNKLKIISEAALLLPNTDRLQQVEEYIRGCTTSNSAPLDIIFNLLRLVSIRYKQCNL